MTIKEAEVFLNDYTNCYSGVHTCICFYWAPYRGFHVSLEYVPTRSNRSGCSSRSEISDLTLELLQDIEKECELYAGALDAEMYSSPES